jgi:hypothetical protein
MGYRSYATCRTGKSVIYYNLKSFKAEIFDQVIVPLSKDC